MAGVADERSGLDVLIVSQPVEYGVAVCVRQQAEAAVKAGHRVKVACPGPEHGPLADWVEAAGAEHVPLALVRQPGPLDLTAVWHLRKLARDRDVVHLHSSKAGAVGRMAISSLGRGARPAVVFTPHYWSWQVGGRLARVYRWIERVLARRCDAIVAVSEQEAAEGRTVLGSAVDHTVVIPNGVDRVRFNPDGARAERPEGSALIVCVGRLSEQKGQDLAIQALARLEQERVLLRLVGDEHPPGEKRRLQALAESLGVSDRIEWTGSVPDTAPHLRAADIVIAPSRWEGMSLVFLEAMACGAAMVVADVFGSDAVGAAGVIVPVDDVGGLADAVDGLLSNEERRQRLGEAARARSADYDVATTLARNLQLWGELAG